MEAVLYGKLKALRVPLWTEQQLRQMGFHKTPDAYLQVPISVKGRLVRWIDSKAAYGSPKLHWCSQSHPCQTPPPPLSPCLPPSSPSSLLPPFLIPFPSLRSESHRVYREQSSKS